MRQCYFFGKSIQYNSFSQGNINDDMMSCFTFEIEISFLTQYDNFSNSNIIFDMI